MTAAKKNKNQEPPSEDDSKRVHDAAAQPVAQNDAAGADEERDDGPGQTDGQSQRSSAVCPVVGVGASAGGLEPIQELLGHLPDNTHLALVIVQHRAHDRQSMMASLLGKHTRMQIEELKDGREVQPGRVYLAPADKNVSIMNGTLFCTESGRQKVPPLPIDHFFRSLAQDQADRAVGIVLSGTGSDGTLGLKEIKAAGGMTMVQDPKQASYDQMPRSAIDTGLVDYVCPVEKMPDELVNYLKHPYIQRPPAEETERKLEGQLQKVFLIIRQETGHDFSHYKRNTIKRRIARRLALHQIKNLEDYIQYLHHSPEETQILSKELLITVTAFFRDPQAFDALGQKVLKPLVRDTPTNATLRIWVPGCATGEEAYSVAMLVYEQMHENNKLHEIQIFGTDLDEDAIEQARSGRYPKSVAAGISAERLDQFFTEQDNHYRVKTHIREMLVFALHNLIKEPPFSRLDLVCCRNVLIYMDSTLQEKVLPLFRYALNPGGYLFLGESESIGKFADLFEPVDMRHKLFRRKKGRADYEPTDVEFRVRQQAGKTEHGKAETAARPRDISGMAEKLILREYSAPCVLVDQENNAVYFNGDTSPYLAQPGGQPTLNLLHMARPELHNKLANAIKRARREHHKVVEEKIPVGITDLYSGTDIIIHPIREFEGDSQSLLVVFRPRERELQPSEQDHAPLDMPSEKKDARIQALEQELRNSA